MPGAVNGIDERVEWFGRGWWEYWGGGVGGGRWNWITFRIRNPIDQKEERWWWK